MSPLKNNYVSIDYWGKVARGKSKHRPRNAPHLYNGPYPFIQTAEITNSGLFITQYSQTYSESGLSQSKLWNPGTLCIVNAGVNTGDNSILAFKSCFPDSIISFTANNACEVRFIKYMLDSIKSGIKSITMGATQDNLSVSKLLTFKTHKTPFAIQKKIAAILSAYDELIENNNRRIAILEKMAEEIYKEWFVRMRFSGHEKVKIVKGVPEGWEVVKVKDIVDRKYFGRIYRENELSDIGKIIVIDQSIKNFLGYYSGEPEHVASIDEPIILFGDHSCKMLLMIEPFSLAENVIPYKSKNKIPIVFLFYLVHNLIETTEYKRHWNELINKSVFLPDPKLQEMYSTNIKYLLLKINKLIETNQNLKKSRDLLLPRLISGKLDVENLNISFPPGMRETSPNTELEVAHA